MPWRVTVNRLSSASKHSKQAEDVSLVKCEREYWPVIQPDESDGLARMPLTLIGLNSSGDVYPGQGEWRIEGESLRIFEGPDGGKPLTAGTVASFPLVVYAEGLKKGVTNLTLKLLPGVGVLKDNPTTESLLVRDPRPLLTLEPKVIGVKGASAKLTLSADMPFDKGVLTVSSGGESIELKQGDSALATREFTSKTEIEVKPVKGSSLEGVEFQWKLEGVAETVTAKLTVVQGTLEIHDKRDATIGSKQRVVHKDKSRAKVVVSCLPKEWAGQLELESASSKVKLFTNPAGPVGAGAKRQMAASATPATFYVQGLETSDALWDAELKLHLVGLATDVDTATVTVIETVLQVSKPHVPAAAVVRDARVADFGTGPGVLSVPPVEGSGEVTLFKQNTQFRASRALVRVTMKPKDAPCKLILKSVQDRDNATLFPEANERHLLNEAAAVNHATPLEIPAGGIALAESARAGVGNAGRYGADGYVLWADGTNTSVTATVVRLDVEDVDDDCAKVKFNVTLPKLHIEVRRSDGAAFQGAVDVEVTDVATADQVGVISFQQTIARPVHPNPARCTFDVPVGNYRVKVVSQHPVESKFRVTLTAPAELPATVVGPPVTVVFVLDEPYRWIQFIGHRLKTGAYMGLDGPAALSLQQRTNAETQAKAFAFSSVLDAVDAKVLSGDVSAPALKTDLKGKNFDQVKADLPLAGRVNTITGLDLDRAYAKELAGVKRNIARRAGARSDIRKRCEVMVAAVKQAFAATGHAADPRVLKVFMAPEFYFRGEQGAYAVESLHQILPLLSAETSKGKYKDWLFVFGSAIGYREKPDAPYQDVTATPVPNTTKTKVFVASHKELPASLAAVGWDFLVGTTAHAIEQEQHADNDPWYNFTLTLDGVVSYPAANASLAVGNAGKVAVTNATKTAFGRFMFKKVHGALTIQPGWVLKRGGARLEIVTATRIDNRNWDLEVKLKPHKTVATGRGEVTEGRLSRDHSGTFTLDRYVIHVDYPAGNLVSKCIWSKATCIGDGVDFFKLRVAGAMAGTHDVEDAVAVSATSKSLHVAAAAAPVWKAGASALTVSPDRCAVLPTEEYKDVHMTIDFVTGTFPAKGWKFEQGTVKGLVLDVTNPNANKRDVVLRLSVDQALNPAAPIKFMTSSGSVEIFNVCFVEKGGAGAPASGDGVALKQRMVEKESISSVDFAGVEYGTLDFYDPLHYLVRFFDSQLRVAPRQGARPDIDGTADPTLQNKPGSVQTFRSKFGDERDGPVHTRHISEQSASGLGGGSLFDMDGLSFGLEVCLDHLSQRLKKSAAPPVRVQLIPACGMTITDPSKHMLPNGFIFNVDGGSVLSDAQKANGTPIPAAVTPFVSGVAESPQLFVAEGDIVVHQRELLT